MKILLITPPFTQLNTPYPATTYLKGFLKLHGHDVFQADLGIELINRIFSSGGLQQILDRAEMSGGNYQTLMNEALRQFAQGITLADVVRETIRKELHQV